jgi:allophanate hydrolase subunit 2
MRVAEAGHAGLRALVSATWTVASVARSGVRLSGGPIPASGTVPSMPMVPGAIQATPAGEAVVLGPDGGLTGGYPVVGVVVTADLDRLSLLAPGDRVAFRSVAVADAAAARRDQLATLRRAVAHPDHLP